jgi:hypothetical protein
MQTCEFCHSRNFQEMRAENGTEVFVIITELQGTTVCRASYADLPAESSIQLRVGSAALNWPCE